MNKVSKRGMHVYLRFSVVKKGGLEIAIYEPAPSPFVNDSDIFSGFMEALQSISEEIGRPIRHLQLDTFTLYIRKFEEFTLRLIVEEQISENDLTSIFDALYQKSLELLPYIERGQIVNRDICVKMYYPILALLENNKIASTIKEFEVNLNIIPKIIIAGLDNVGKSTIKNLFFEKFGRPKSWQTIPTQGIDTLYHYSEFLTKKFTILDMGGQQMFRLQYLEKDDIWTSISLLIFVVDLQAPNSFNKASKYLSEIWKLVLNNNSKLPRLAIFFHKNDPSKKFKLLNNKPLGLEAFKEFLGFATFHLTSIEDESVFECLIKTMYLAFPHIMLDRIISSLLIHDLEEELIPRFQETLYGIKHTQEIQVPPQLESDIRVSCVNFGKSYGRELQSQWYRYFHEKFNAQKYQANSINMIILKNPQFIQIKLEKTDKFKKSEKLIRIVIQSVLEGITQLFHMPVPVLIQDDSELFVWNLKFIEIVS